MSSDQRVANLPRRSGQSRLSPLFAPAPQTRFGACRFCVPGFDAPIGAPIAMENRENGDCLLCPKAPQSSNASQPAAPQWTERAVLTFRPGPQTRFGACPFCVPGFDAPIGAPIAMENRENGDCLLCPKAPQSTNASQTSRAAVDRAGCPHFSPLPHKHGLAHAAFACRVLMHPSAHRSP